MAMKIIKLATVPVGLVGFVSLRIYAATQEATGENHLLMASQLPIYTPPQKHSKYIEEQPGSLQTTLSIIRHAVHPYTAWCKSSYISIENGIWTTVQFGKDTYVYLKNPPPEFLPKVGVITVSGLAGLVLARNGSRFKKIVYPLGLATFGVSVCYPAQTVIFAKVAGKKVYAASHWSYKTFGSLWRPNTSNDEAALEKIKVAEHIPESVVERPLGDADTSTTVPEITSKPLEKPAGLSQITTDTIPLPVEIGESSVESNRTVTQDEEKMDKFKPDPTIVDHGQSSPEYVDMYSTRS